MKILVQRVLSAELRVDGELRAEIGPGLCAYIGVEAGDAEPQAAWLANKLAHLRVFEDENGKMNRSVLQTGGQILLISNFTLCADCSQGFRPSFSGAERPELARPMTEHFAALLREAGAEVKTGVFGADMKITQLNDGPVSILLSR